MGYTTTFSGRLKIVGANLSKFKEKVKEINDFLSSDHSADGCGFTYKDYVKRYKINTRWCDWIIDQPSRGLYLQWNGKEKSYDMEKWLILINDTFIKPNGLCLEGEVDCFGESPGDIWKIIADKNGIQCKKAKLTFE